MSKTVEISQLKSPDSIHVSIPLTATSGKARIKRRKSWQDYGVVVPTRRAALAQSCYLEWQIGYDATISDLNKGMKTTSVPECRFVGANGKEKSLFELSEYLYYLSKWGIIPLSSLLLVANEIEGLGANELFDENDALMIRRTHPIPKNLCGFEFDFMRVEYPLVVYRCGGYDVLIEIMVREQQRAAGIQPMLYVCIPVSELNAKPGLVGRTARLNECAELIIDKNNARTFLDIFRLFGRLSQNHRHDVLAIIKTIIESLRRESL